MFAPTKIWRRWHRRVNVNQRRFALVSALAASALPALVLARGHRVEEVAEVPLVVADAAFAEVKGKTSAAQALLGRLKALADVTRAKESRQLRAGKGKMRNRRYVSRRGPLLVHSGGAELSHAFRNLPGVDIAHVDRLNLLQLAPGGHVGRFVIWTESAFGRLEHLYGSQTRTSAAKSGYRLPRAVVTNPDLDRIVNSDEIQSRLRAKHARARPYRQKKNPLTNLGALLRLNPYAKTLRRRQLLASTAAGRAAVLAAKRNATAPKKGPVAPKAGKPAPKPPAVAKKPKKKVTPSKQKKVVRKHHAKFIKLLLSN